MFADITNPDRPPDNTVQMPPIPNRVALYIGPGDDDGNERERALRRYAGTLGLDVVAVYRDEDGAGLPRLIEDARGDQFDAVAVADRADVAPDTTDYDRLRDSLTEVSVRLLVADETAT